jgi:flagellar hook assembly protein FlgD
LNVNSQPRIFSPQGNGYDDKTAISFNLGKESNVTIKIYNPAGRLVKILTENENMSHGNNVVYWDGKNQQGEFCVSGLYIVTIQAEEKMATKTVVVLNKN